MYVFNKWWIKFLLLVPSLILFSVYTLYSFFYSFGVGFFEHYELKKAWTFIGLQNYAQLLQDNVFVHSVANNLIMLVLELALMLPLGILVGLLLSKNFHGGGFVKTVTFIPYILSGIMIGLIWLFILDPSIGLINAGLNAMGLGFLAKEWIGGLVLSPYTFSVVDTWKNLGFYSVLFMAGMKMIPRETYEAATIDGASPFQQTIYVTLPLLRETIKTAVVMIITYAINGSFTTVYMLTNGGPNDVSHTISTYFYKVMFVSYNQGYATSMAVIMCLLTMLFSIVTLRATQRKVGD